MVFRKQKSTKKKSTGRSHRVKHDDFEDLPDLVDSMDDSMDKFAHDFQSRNYGYGNIRIIIFSVLVGMLLGAMGALYYGQMGQKQAMEKYQLESDKRKSMSLEEKLVDTTRIEYIGESSVYEVNDITKLREIPIYALAKNGDKVVNYRDVTIIYDEENDKIVSMVPQALVDAFLEDEKPQTDSSELNNDIVTDDTQDNSQQEDADTSDDNNEDLQEDSDAQEVKTISIEVRNGTGVSGLAGRTGTQIETEVENTQTKAANAASRYESGMIIDLSNGKYAESIAQLKELLDIATIETQLPSGEANTTADIVIILGQ